MGRCESQKDDVLRVSFSFFVRPLGSFSQVIWKNKTDGNNKL